jgi:hypothetical protein
MEEEKILGLRKIKVARSHQELILLYFRATMIHAYRKDNISFLEFLLLLWVALRPTVSMKVLGFVNSPAYSPKLVTLTIFIC